MHVWKEIEEANIPVWKLLISFVFFFVRWKMPQVLHIITIFAFSLDIAWFGLVCVLNQYLKRQSFVHSQATRNSNGWQYNTTVFIRGSHPAVHTGMQVHGTLKACTRGLVDILQACFHQYFHPSWRDMQTYNVCLDIDMCWQRLLKWPLCWFDCSIASKEAPTIPAGADRGSERKYCFATTMRLQSYERAQHIL